jgi:hypothetical protein
MARDPRKMLILVPALLIVSPLALGRSSTSTDGRHTQWVINFFSSLALRLAQIEADAKVRQVLFSFVTKGETQALGRVPK